MSRFESLQKAQDKLTRSFITSSDTQIVELRLCTSAEVFNTYNTRKFSALDVARYLPANFVLTSEADGCIARRSRKAAQLDAHGHLHGHQLQYGLSAAAYGLLEERLVSREALAERSHVRVAFIQRVERGEGNPSLATRATGHSPQSTSGTSSNLDQG